MRLTPTLLTGAMAASAALLVVPAAADSPTTRVLQPSLSRHLAATAPTAAVRVLVQAGGSLSTAVEAVRSAGLRLETTLPRVGIAVADGTPGSVVRLGSTRGVTRLDWADQPVRLLGNSTSQEATRAVPVQDGAYDVDGNGTGDAFDGKGFAVAIVDGGVDGTHPMFQGSGGSKVRKNVKVLCSDVLPGLTGYTSTYDSCVVDQTAVNDTDTTSVGGHGTLVAGVAAGNRITDRNGRVLRGSAPGAEIDAVGMGAVISTYGGAVGMYWVLEHHADPCGDHSCAPIVAVNNSWAPDVSDTDYTTAPGAVVARALVADGVTVVWAAGNDGGDGTQDRVQVNAQDPTPGVLAVANYDDGGIGSRDNALATDSSRGLRSDVSTYPDLSAPGTGITSACRPTLPTCTDSLDTSDPNYATLSGTSLAAPHVTGYVAVLQQAAAATLHRLLTPAEIEDLLVDTAHHFGSTTWVTDSRNPAATTQTSFDEGHGLVDLTAALARLTGRTLTYPGQLGCTSDARFSDPAGDAGDTAGVGTGLPNEAGLDITAGWFTSDAAHDVTAHVRVADLPDTPGGTEGGGEQFDVSFTYAGKGYRLRAQRDPFLGQTFSLTDSSGGPLATLTTGSFDPAADEVSVMLPPGVIASVSPGAPVLTAGSVLYQPMVTGMRFLLTGSVTDTAHGRCDYAVS